MCQEFFVNLLSGEIIFRVVRDFDRNQMNYREKAELKLILAVIKELEKDGEEIDHNNISEEDRLAEFTTVTKEIDDERRHVPSQNKSHQIRY